MLDRLKKVSDSSHLKERFYPLLLQEAGSEKFPEGVVMMLTLAIYDYTQHLPKEMVIAMSMQVPRFIDALVPDPKIASEVKQLWEKANG